MMKTWTGQDWRGFQDGDLRPDDRGFLLGDGVFETLRVKDATLRRGDLHRARFEAACRAMELDCPARWEAIAEGAETAGEDAMVRVTLSRGVGPRGLGVIEAPRPGLFLSASPVSEPPDGLALVTAPLRRSLSSLASRHKTLSYADNAAARRAAVRAGGDMALCLTTQGHVSGGDCANIFWIYGSELVTPSPECAIRTGVTREAVMKCAADAGLPVREGMFSPDALQAAEAIFVTNCALGVVPVKSLDGQGFDVRHGALQALKRAEAIAG